MDLLFIISPILLIPLIWHKEITRLIKQRKCKHNCYSFSHMDYFAFVPWRVYKCAGCGKEKSILGKGN